MNTQFDALIIGAGVAGSSTAILLARAGWSVALIEKQRFPRRKVCGECVSATNLPLLDALGMGEIIEAHAGAQLRRVALSRGEDLVTADLPRYDHPRHPWGRAIGREFLDDALMQRAATCGAEVWQPWEVRQTERTSNRYVCTLESLDNGQTAQLAVPLLVDAHGSWQTPPRQLRQDGCTTPGVPARRAHADSDLFAFKGNFTGSGLDPHLLPLLAFSGGYGGMVQGAHGQLTLACCIRRDVLKALRNLAPGRRAGQVVQDHLRRSCGIVHQALSTASPQHPWLSVGPVRPGVRRPAPAPGRFAVGNAAGEAHPILGEGMSMAVQSAWLLVTSLQATTAGSSMDRMLEQAAIQYSAAWRKNFTVRMHMAALIAGMLMQRSSATALWPLIARWPSMLTAGARLAGKVRCAVADGQLQLSPLETTAGMTH